MANNFTSNPIILDTVMASGYQATILGVPNNLKLYPRVIHWDAPTTAGHQFEIDDAVVGNILFKATCRANNQGEYYEVADGVRWPAQWKLVTLQSGVLYIYFTT
jgi:hypothetical protein